MEHAATASRILMGDSLGFHIIFVMFGLTLPILVSWLELTGMRKHDKRYTDIAHFWSKIMALLVITGVISGTIIALQMSLVWPGILKFGGSVIGLPFMFETYAFLIEAVFLALYMTTWNKKSVSPFVHWLFGLGIIIGSTLSAFAITSVNGWMNLPSGFTVVSGKFANIDVLGAMFSETSLVEFIHSMPGYYLASAMAIAGLYAFRLIRNGNHTKKRDMDFVVIKRLMIFSAVMLIGSTITADITGKYLSRHEPAKLATIEMVDKTGPNAPFVFGGFENQKGEVTGPYIKIPGVLSLLAGGSTKSAVTGLNDIPKVERPPSAIRPIFNLKLTLIIVIALVIAGYLIIWWRKPAWLKSRLVLIIVAVSGFLGVIIVEFGWMITEIGRQPWAVRGYVTTEQALTKTHDITTFGYVFPIAYVLLFSVTFLAMRKIIRTAAQKRGAV